MKSNKKTIVLLFFATTQIILLNSCKKITIHYSDENSTNLTTETPNSDNSDSYSESTTTCKVCGRDFTGDGYDKIDGVWQRNANIQTELCSQNCAMIYNQKQNKKYNAILVKHGYAPIDFDSQSSTSNHPQPNRNGYITGSDGMIYENSPCDLCRGTGYEINTAQHILGGPSRRICPMCQGKGVKSY